MKIDSTKQRTQLYRDQSSGSAPVPSSSYGGIPEQSRAGLLSHVAALVRSCVQPGARIVDLAAGSGALALRLHDAGYNVEAVDYVEENFRPRGKIQFRQLDLNTNFSSQYSDQFDAIVATEIIEHLENPRNFLREISLVLKPGGLLFLTTPNVDCPVSQAFLLGLGYPLWFSDSDYDVLGHVTPISVRILTQCATEVGFCIENLESFANPWELLSGWPKMRWFARLITLLSATPKNLRGDILVAVLKSKGN